MASDIERDIKMIYAIKEIAGTFKQARERKGLSQRELSALSGVRQYQISKFENGAVDLRLSSLIELTRALDLELTLVPRKSVSAVKSIVRSSEPKGAGTTTLKELNRTLDAVRSLRATYPELDALTKLQNNIQAFRNIQGIGREMEALREITKPVRELQKLTETSRKLAQAASLSREQLRALQEASTAAQSLRNQLVHNIAVTPSPSPRPAYSLDEEGSDG
jgi:transcriptional regulator with XRE-family HTH domain